MNLSRGACSLVCLAIGAGGCSSNTPSISADSGAGDSGVAEASQAEGGGEGGAESGDAGTCNLTVPPRRLALGVQWGCGLRSNHVAECWGTPSAGAVNPITPPNAAQLFSAVCASDLWLCGLSSPDGTAICWGDGPGHTPSEPGAIDVSVGEAHACALNPCGDVVCWGDDLQAQTPPAGTRFSRVAAGWSFTCGVVLGSGAIQCWGANDVGQATPPSGSFTEVATGEKHACAIAMDGTVHCWGAGSAASLTDAGVDGGSNFDFGQAMPPSGKFQMVSAGDFHTCGVRDDGTVACWGAGTTNADCAGPSLACGQSMPPAGAFQEVRAAFTNSCGILKTGGIACWGSNTGGRSTPPSDFQ